MIGLFDRIKEAKRQKLLVSSLVEDKPKPIHENFVPEEIAAYRQTEETFAVYDKGEERTVLTMAQKTAFAVALDNFSYQVLDYLSPLYQANPPVAFFETQTVRGLVTQDKIRQTKFKSIQRTPVTLLQYLERWNQANNGLLFRTDAASKLQQEVYRSTLKVLREEYGVEGSEFGTQRY